MVAAVGRRASNSRRRLAASGIEVREWQIDPDTGHLNPDDLDNLLDDKVRLVCFPHVSNVVGEVNDVAAICAAVERHGASGNCAAIGYHRPSTPARNELHRGGVWRGTRGH